MRLIYILVYMIILPVLHIAMHIMDFAIMFQQRGILQRDMEKSLLQIGLGVR